MAQTPQLTDYVAIIIELFDRFRQERNAREWAKPGRPFTFFVLSLPIQQRAKGRTEESFVTFFMLMQYRRISASKSQWRWLRKHPEFVETPGWIPHVTTIVRRDMRLYDLLQAFVLISPGRIQLDALYFSRFVVLTLGPTIFHRLK